MGVAAPPSDAEDVIVFLDPDGFDALAPGSAWEAQADALALCAARSGERVALRLKPEPSPSAPVLMDEDVRALAAGAHLVVGEAGTTVAEHGSTGRQPCRCRSRWCEAWSTRSTSSDR